MIRPEDLDLLLPDAPVDGDASGWATVTQVSPLRVRPDGEATALAVTPDSLTGPLEVGARVWVQRTGRRLMVLGCGGGEFAGAWTSWTPTLTASVTSPTIGTTGTAHGAYRRMGRTVHWRATIQSGGTGINAGDGQYYIAPPFAPAGGFQIVGTGWVYGTSGFKPFVADSGTGRLIRTDTGAGVDHTIGLTVAGHVITITGTFEAIS